MEVPKIKDPCTDSSFRNGFTFSGTITDIVKSAKKLEITVHQIVAGRIPTDYKLLIPLTAIPDDSEFPYIQGDTVLVQDALVYEKNGEIRTRISSPLQIKRCSDEGLLNSLSFTGKIVEVQEEARFKLVTMEQDVRETLKTRIEVMVLNTLSVYPPKVGDIGFIWDALFYEKDGKYRAKLERDTYKCFYTPDIVMDMQTIEAKELFADCIRDQQ